MQNVFAEAGYSKSDPQVKSLFFRFSKPTVLMFNLFLFQIQQGLVHSLRLITLTKERCFKSNDGFSLSRFRFRFVRGTEGGGGK